MLNVIWEKSFLILCYCFQILQSLKIVLIYFLCETFGLLFIILTYIYQAVTSPPPLLSRTHKLLADVESYYVVKAEIYSCWTKKLFYFFIWNYKCYSSFRFFRTCPWNTRTTGWREIMKIYLCEKRFLFWVHLCFVSYNKNVLLST